MKISLRFVTEILAALLVCLGGATAEDARIEVACDGPARPVSRLLTGACIEDVNHEIYGGIYSQMIFGESFQEPGPAAAGARKHVSGMWRPVIQGSASGSYSLAAAHPFLGAQSQQITFESGEGEVGIENQGLNRWGMNFMAGKPYEGCLWAAC